MLCSSFCKRSYYLFVVLLFRLVCVCDCGKAELVAAVEEGKNNTLGRGLNHLIFVITHSVNMYMLLCVC